MKLGLFIGCGPKPFHEQHLKLMEGLGGEWYVADLFCAGDGILQMDARDLKFNDGQLDYIYASHLLEHISHRQTLSTLKHWYLKLKVGGKVILNVPDMKWVVKLLTGKVKSNRWNEWDGDNGILNIIYGGQVHEGEFHKTGFTKEYIEILLNEAGFKNISTKEEVEAHEFGCLIVEATK